MKTKANELIKKLVKIMDANDPKQLNKIINLINSEGLDLSKIKTSNNTFYNIISNIFYLKNTTTAPFGALASEEDKKANYNERLSILKKEVETYLNGVTEYTNEDKILSIFSNNM